MVMPLDFLRLSVPLFGQASMFPFLSWWKNRFATSSGPRVVTAPLAVLFRAACFFFLRTYCLPEAHISSFPWLFLWRSARYIFLPLIPAFYGGY